MQRRARVVQLLLLGGALLRLDRAQLLEPGLGAPASRRRPTRGSRPGVAATSPTRSTSRRAVRGQRVGRGVEPDQLGLLAEAAAEAEPEVDRDADDERHVGAPEPGAARAAEGKLVIGGEAAAAEAVEEDGDAERLGQRPQLAPPRGPSRDRCRP